MIFNVLTDLNPSENNNILNQTNGLPNTVNVHEETALHNVYKDIAEVFNLNRYSNAAVVRF